MKILTNQDILELASTSKRHAIVAELNINKHVLESIIDCHPDAPTNNALFNRMIFLRIIKPSNIVAFDSYEEYDSWYNSVAAFIDNPSCEFTIYF